MERYEKLRVIGQGAFGKVFLVLRKTDESQVVIKQIPVDDLGKEERFSALNEVKVLAMLKHPNIIAYYDNFVEEKSLMIVMEYAPGGTLHDFIQERNGLLLDEDHVLLFFVQLVVAIDHVHRLKILHRDLKTQNIMMNRKRTILKIGDFGISKVLSSKITSAQTVVGTPCYISPEICEGKMYATKSDIWALGCILYELTTLKKAFEGPNLPALVLKIMHASASLEPLDPAYSGSLKDLIYSLLQRNAEDRPDLSRVLATPLLVNAHMNLSTDVGRLPCTKINPETNTPITCTRMNSKGLPIDHSYLVEDYVSPGELGMAPPKPVVYLWGGGITAPMKVDPPVALTDSKLASVACGRTQRSGVTDDGKLIFWEPSAESMTTHFTMNPKARGRGRKREPLQLEPRLIGGLKTTAIKKVSCGDMFTACLTDNGILMTFGNGANGALGHGDYNDVMEPKLVHAMLEFETTEVSCGSYHVIAITSEGTVYAWGNGNKGRLGLGSHDQYNTPQRVFLPVAASTPVSAACGSDCSIILTNSGQLLASGANTHNKLMLNKRPVKSSDSGREAGQTNSSGGSGISVNKDDTPAILKLFQNPPSTSHSLMAQKGMTFGGKGWGLGITMGGSPARGHVIKPPEWMVSESLTFTLSGSELVQQTNIISASVGINHSALLTASGEVLTCGDNSCGQLGRQKAPPPTDSKSQQERFPEVVSALYGIEITKLTCGDYFCIACSKDGAIYSWGRGRESRLGRDKDEDVFEPQKIPFEFSSHQVQGLCSSHRNTILLTVPQV